GSARASAAGPTERACRRARQQTAASARPAPLAHRDLLAVVAQPGVAKLAPQLADPPRRHLELLAQVLGALALGHRPDEAPLAAGERPEPGREINAERGLVGDTTCTARSCGRR